MGYRDGQYDVYYAEVVKYNNGKNEYYSFRNNFANITNSGGSATFQFDNYKEAQQKYDKLLEAYNANGYVTYTDISKNGLLKQGGFSYYKPPYLEINHSFIQGLEDFIQYMDHFI